MLFNQNPDYFNQETERLLFRRLTETDIDSWVDFFINNDRLDYLGFDLNKDYTTLATEWIQKQLDRYENEGLGHLAVIDKQDKQFIGMAGIIPRVLNNQNYFEIAYSLKPAFWNKGYGTEMARQMRNFGTDNGISQYFISIIHVANDASKHVAEKNGMRPLFDSTFMEMPVTVFSDN